jgi:hypothetical protein
VVFWVVLHMKMWFGGCFLAFWGVFYHENVVFGGVFYGVDWRKSEIRFKNRFLYLPFYTIFYHFCSFLYHFGSFSLIFIPFSLIFPHLLTHFGPIFPHFPLYAGTSTTPCTSVTSRSSGSPLSTRSSSFSY